MLASSCSALGNGSRPGAGSDRANYARMIYHRLGYDNLAAGVRVFYDVPLFRGAKRPPQCLTPHDNETGSDDDAGTEQAHGIRHFVKHEVA